MYCYKCGSQLPDGTPVCPNCQSLLTEAPVTQRDNSGKTPEGYSLKVDSPEMEKYLGKQRKWRNIFLVLVVLGPIVGFLIAAQFSRNMTTEDAVIYGPCVSLIMFCFGIYPTVKQKLQKSYIGAVIDKYSKTKIIDDENTTRIRTTYYIVTRDQRGKKHKHKSTGYEGVYDFLEVGDEIRYLPQFENPFEKKLGPTDTHTCCQFCQSVVSLDNDTCPRCKAPILK